MNDLVAVDVAALLRDRLAAQDVHRDDIVLVEALCPALGDAVFDLILDHVLVRTLGKSLSQRLLVQLVKLVVKLCDHLLDVSRFFLSIELLEDGNLNIVLLKHALLDHGQERLLSKHVFDLGVFVPTKKLDVSLVDLIDELRVDLHVWHRWDLFVIAETDRHATGERRWLIRVHSWSHHGGVASVLGDLLL